MCVCGSSSPCARNQERWESNGANYRIHIIPLENRSLRSRRDEPSSFRYHQNVTQKIILNQKWKEWIFLGVRNFVSQNVRAKDQERTASNQLLVQEEPSRSAAEWAIRLFIPEKPREDKLVFGVCCLITTRLCLKSHYLLKCW